MIGTGNNTMKQLDVMQMAMGASVKRKQLIDNNIANASTPNYKRQDITFHAELKRSLDSEKYYPGEPFKTSREKHIPIMRVKDYRDVEAKKFTEFNTYQNNDGNSVDIEKEMMENTKNTLYYNALVQRSTKEFNKIKFLLRQ